MSLITMKARLIPEKARYIPFEGGVNYTGMCVDIPAVDVGFVHNAGWAVQLGYGLRGGGRLGD